MFLSAILGVDSTLKPARITNQEKHCDYVIHGYTDCKSFIFAVCRLP